jgi:hypothetical protein
MDNPYTAPRANVGNGPETNFRGFVLQIALGTAYVLMQIELIRFYARYFGSIETDLSRIASVCASTAISLLILFLANHFLFKTRAVALGLVSGAAFFTYFYVIHPAGDRLFLLLDVLTYWPSLINMLLAVGGPVATALVFRLMPNNSFKPKPLRGSA